MPERYYTLCSYSIDYSTRVFVNGVEAAAFGTVADSASASVPRIGYMTIPLYSGETGEIEIIYQFSNFVHRDGGFIQPTYLSTPQNMEDFKAGENLAALSLSGGLLVLFLYFLLCAAVQRRVSFLLLAVCCMMMALRDQNFLVVHALPPDTSWYFAYRIFMCVTSLLPGMVLLLLGSMYPSVVKKLPTSCTRGLHGDRSGAHCCFAHDMAGNGVHSLVELHSALPRVHRLEHRQILCAPENVRRCGRADGERRGDHYHLHTAGGHSLSTAARPSAATGTMPWGMLVFDLLMAAAISLRAREQEIALAESRSRSEMLEQMNAMNLDFLHQIAHELKTPLTVISGYAQLTGLQMSSGNISSETPENLRVIRNEALRLSDMVTKLLEYSYGKTSEIPVCRS